jgi:hypothetical protein
VFFCILMCCCASPLPPPIIIFRLFMKTLFLLLLLPAGLSAQDITGVWTGHIQTSGSELPYEIVITQHSEKLSGYSLMTFTINGNENDGIKSITLKNKNGNISIEDEELIYNNYTTPPKRVKLFSNLSLSMQDSVMTMKGSFKTRAMDFRASDNLSYSGTIELIRQSLNTKSKLMSMLGQLNLLNALSFNQPKTIKQADPVSPRLLKDKTANTDSTESADFSLVKRKDLAAPVLGIKKSFNIPQPGKISEGERNNLSFPEVNMDSVIKAKIIDDANERKTSIVRSVFFTADSLVLSLYDNGVVDGDTVSIVVNGRVILANQGLTTRAIRYILHATPELGDSLLITMVAENLGSIPPNTGLLVIQDGDQRNEIMFSGDMEMSSAVLFRRKH